MPQRKQDKDKSRRRAADLTIQPPAQPKWERPADDDCHPDDRWSTELDASGDHVVKVRLVNELLTNKLVEFAVLQRVLIGRTWHDVVLIDSCHHDEVHAHWYTRATDDDLRTRQTLMPITCRDDLDAGYDMAYEMVFKSWERNVERWQHG